MTVLMQRLGKTAFSDLLVVLNLTKNFLTLNSFHGQNFAFQ